MSNRTITRRTLLATTMVAVAVPAFSQVRFSYRDAKAPIADRVRDLLGRMTLEEKVGQVRCLWFNKGQILDGRGAFSPENALKVIPQGIGQVGMPQDTVGTDRITTTLWRGAEETVDLVNAIQRFHVERTRLGIPALFHSEAAHGFVCDGATVFPSPPAMGSSWDPELVEQAFTVAAREARLSGTTVVLAPVVDLLREPRWGRSGESFGEDPYLVGEMAIAAVRGLQGRTRPLQRDRVFATLKHFVHGVPENGLNTAPANASERDLRENYLVPFAMAIKAADPAIIMPSYNEVEGVPSHGNRHLLQGMGREEMGFKGAYFSDYNGVANLVGDHHVAADDDEAAMLALKAGLDAELPDGQAYARLPGLIRAGKISETLLDAAVARILALKFEAGLFEQPYVNAGRQKRGINLPADIALARKVAQKGLVLLKNDGLLPLDPSAHVRLAVIGPNATEPIFGGYSGVNAKAVGVLAGLRAAGAAASIEYAEGVRITDPDTGNSLGAFSLLAGPAVIRVSAEANAARIREAVAVAQRSDLILLVLGDNTTVTREAVLAIREGDRSTLGLFGDQDALVEAMIATGKPIVAMMLNGRPLAITRLAEKANALIEGWYLGQEGGNAVADLLFGKINPGGKLTVSIAKSSGDLPIYYNRHPSARNRNYVEGGPAALFPFGHGLSYTSFDISEPRLSASEIKVGEKVVVEVDVTNTGKRAGDEVVQLYLRDEVSSVPRPVLELKRFERVTLAAGERRTVHFEIDADALAFWDIDMRWTVEPGAFTISAGASSTSLKSAKLRVV
ncbi:glycoside hydrolase family 3 N-terminal domain-containing protein [Sphingomonas solaris]|uniref:Beta-D-glucoside glucohydrolase n=1 Tax=Alterirhizorhabdus solaris TaxID=2529389 RepID=A0A558R450_9SPHN|nr:glycoside hydrolase family 3 N-terminal domain-containing protein [Sphingomonas solaris]TVV74165.1 beta-glucosidase [Sphingomonas solaris]